MRVTEGKAPLIQTQKNDAHSDQTFFPVLPVANLFLTSDMR